MQVRFVPRTGGPDNLVCEAEAVDSQRVPGKGRSVKWTAIGLHEDSQELFVAVVDVLNATDAFGWAAQDVQSAYQLTLLGAWSHANPDIVAAPYDESGHPANAMDFLAGWGPA